MNGQGSPISERAPSWRFAQAVLGLVLLCACAETAAEETAFRLRIDWGGQSSRLWRGSISLSRGAFSELKPLGLEPDQPGSLLNQGGKILVAPRKPHRYDGLEVLATAAEDDVLRIELTPGRDTSSTRRLDIPFATLRKEGHSLVLDELENRVRVTRAPGDSLRILFQRDSLVFSPSEPWAIDVVPHQLDVKPGTSLRARLRLKSATKIRNEVTDFLKLNEDLWSHEAELRVDDDGQIPRLQKLPVSIPAEEGVYDLTVDLVRGRGINVPFSQRGPVAQRKLQLIVVGTVSPLVSGGGPSTLVTEFNPADPHWFERLTQLPQWKLLPLARRGPWTPQDGTKQPGIWHDDERKSWTRLPAGAWIAYPLPVATSGIPHVIDIQFPGNLPQDVAISVLEPNAAGELTPVGLDSGLSLGDRDLTLPSISLGSGPKNHRLVFWPNTSSPVVLITNQQADRTATFGRIRLEVYRQGLPVARSRSSQTRQRMAVFERPLFTKNFLAPESLDPSPKNQFSLEDWNTFYKAGRRLVEYLRFAGYDGATIAAACEGSALYPTRLLEPTPKHDNGVFFSTGQDARRKDVLEMLFRLFDREGLTLIPSLEFATPLPALEQELASGRSAGIELENAAGLKWFQQQANRSGLAPYYNPLNLRVQNAMLLVVNELTGRYSRHASFGGVNLNMFADGYTHLPDVDWGLDAETIGEFQRESQTEQAASPHFAKQLRHSIHSLEQNPGGLRTQWLGWRARRLGRLYQNMGQLVQNRSGQPLYISMAPLVESAPWQRHLRPVLPERTGIDAAMLDVGLDADILAAEPSLILLRPQRLGPLAVLGSQAVNLELAAPEIQRFFSSKSHSTVQFYYEPQPRRLKSFDAQGPFDRARTLLLSHFERAGAEARRHFAHSLAERDDQIVFDGGQLLPMGQEDALSSYFDVFRQLPNRPFQTVSLDGAAPVVVRTLTDARDTYVYLVNDSPWPTETSLEWEAPVGCAVNSLGLHTLEERSQSNNLGAGRLTIAPYDLAAFRFSSPRVQLRTCKSKLPPTVAGELASQFDEIKSRAKQIEKHVPIDLLQDPDFALPLGQGSAWTASQRSGTEATIAPGPFEAGNPSLRLRSTGGTIAVTSHAFDVPATGRLFLSVRLRANDTNQQPSLIMRLETNDAQYEPFHQFKTPLTATVIRVDDIPFDPHLRMRIRFELRGAGDIWLDEIRLFDKWFELPEHRALEKDLYLAYDHQTRGEYGACYQRLTGYWPRFLLRHVPSVEERIATRPLPPGVRPEPQKKTSVLDVLKGYVPRILR